MGAPSRRRRRLWAGLLLALVLGGAGALVAGRSQPDPLLLLDAAARAFDEGQVARSEALLDQRARRAAPTALDIILRARIAQARQRFADALELLERIPDSDQFAGKARLLAGEIELERGRARAAEQLFLRALELDPNQISARRSLAYIYGLQQRRRECDAQFRAMLQLGPLDAKRAFIWCQNLCAIWDAHEAIPRLEQFIGADPADRFSRLSLADGYLLTSQLDAADRVLRALPADDDDARVLRARLALDRNDEGQAEALAKSGARAHPGLNLLRARLALIRRDDHAATQAYRAVLSVEPQNRDALYGLGHCLRRSGDDAGAGALLQRVDRLDRLKRMIVASKGPQGEDPKLYLKLGRACESLGQSLEALTWYGLAIERDPLDNEAQSARAHLKAAVTNGHAAARASRVPA